MKITSSSIKLGSETSALEHHERRESLTLWTAGRRQLPHGGINPEQAAHAGLGQDGGNDPPVTVSLSSKAARARPVPKCAKVQSARPSSIDQLKLDILKALIEKLTGKKIKVTTPDEIMSPADAAGESQDQEVSSGFAMIYDSYESHYEYQEMTFSASGSITTEDGRQIEFQVDLNMTREFYSEQHVQIRAGDALKDPLSVNFSGNAAELTSTRFSFDIDADGRSEQIAFVRPGSGFLVLDRNMDGKINDGRELFGAMTGNGFTELAEFDADGNNFIDDNDPIYHRLRIWEKDREGNDHLLALGQVGIGALYLGSADSAFDLKDQENNLLGRIGSTGLFIREDGTAGTIQQLDLVA